jgi:hypothetical protein
MNELIARVAYINAQVACALARIEGMKAENVHYLQNNGRVKYGEDAFNAVPDEFGISHNAVISYLAG